MSFPRLGKRSPVLPGQSVVVRAHRNLATLLPRIGAGDLVVIDQRDLDGDTARALLARRPFAVLNAAEFISGRFANLGPQVLINGGVHLFEAPRDQVLALRDSSTLRLHEGTLYDGAVVVLDVRELDADQVRDQMEQAQAGLTVQLESFAHAASEFVRREEPLLLHGVGTPALRTSLAGRVVLVAGPSTQRADLKGLRRLLRRTKPVLIGVDAGIDALVAKGLRPDVGILSGHAVVTDRAVRRCREVVLSEAGPSVQGQVEKLNLPFSVVSTGVAPVDLGLLMAHHGRAGLVVRVGSPATLDEFVDRDRSDQASNVLTRLRLGTRLIDGATVPLLRTGRPQVRRRAAVFLGVAALALGVLVLTPVGERFRDDLRDALPQSLGGTEALHREEDKVADRDARLAALRTAQASNDAFIAATAPLVVRGALTGRAVALVVLPGADPETLTGLRALVTAAGAQITGEVTVDPEATSASQAGLVDALTSQMITQAPEVKLAGGSTGYQRFGALLARAAGVPSSTHLQRAPYDATAVGVSSGLQTGGLARAEITARAGLTIILAGEQDNPELASVVAGYGGQVPTVVAGPAGGGSVVAAVRASSAFSTVSGVDTTAGRVAVVLAVAARSRGTIGDYGNGADDGAILPLS